MSSCIIRDIEIPSHQSKCRDWEYYYQDLLYLYDEYTAVRLWLKTWRVVNSDSVCTTSSDFAEFLKGSSIPTTDSGAVELREAALGTDPDIVRTRVTIALIAAGCLSAFVVYNPSVITSSESGTFSKANIGAAAVLLTGASLITSVMMAMIPPADREGLAEFEHDLEVCLRKYDLA